MAQQNPALVWPRPPSITCSTPVAHAQWCPAGYQAGLSCKCAAATSAAPLSPPPPSTPPLFARLAPCPQVRHLVCLGPQRWLQRRVAAVPGRRRVQSRNPKFDCLICRRSSALHACQLAVAGYATQCTALSRAHGGVAHFCSAQHDVWARPRPRCCDPLPSSLVCCPPPCRLTTTTAPTRGWLPPSRP